MMERPTILKSNDSDLSSLSTETAATTVRELCSYVRQLENSLNQLQSTSKSQPEITGTTSVVEDRLRQQQIEASRRENVLVMRLTTKEQEVQEYLNKLEEMRVNAASTSRTVLLDPAVNIMFQRMKQELQQAREQVEQTRQELEAWKFTPDSATGKKLMARCRQLFQENEEMGQKCSSGRVGKLETDLSLARSLNDELRRMQNENDELLVSQDEEMEAMTSLMEGYRNQLKKLQQENRQLRVMAGLGLDGTLEEELKKRNAFQKQGAKRRRAATP